MADFDPNQYGPVFAEFLQGDRLCSLDEGFPDGSVRSQLAALSVDSAFAHAAIADPDMACCCVSGIWLLHDFLDESHTISQSITTTSGSYWHGIMHRREGDFSNAKYWFRKVDHHPVYELLAEQVGEIGEEPSAIAGGDWDAFGFVDACQSALGSGSAEELACQKIQQLEWELLFDYCYSSAISS